MQRRTTERGRSRRASSNTIYQDLLESVFTRQEVWADKQHKVLEGITRDEFFRILEEIAIAAWHGDGRRVTIREIDLRCQEDGLAGLLDKFKLRAESGIADFLVAFYFRRSAVRDSEGNETFEFTHKSFGEYLSSRRLVRGVRKIVKEQVERSASFEDGWDEPTCLKHWLELSRHSPMDEYILSFVRRELKLQEDCLQIQNCLSKLAGYVLRHSLPIDRVLPRPLYTDEVRQVRNSEEGFFAIINGCARVTRRISRIEIPSPTAFNALFLRISENGLYKRERIASEIFSWTDLSSSTLSINLRDFDLSHCDLTRSILDFVDLTNALLYNSVLTSASFRGANFYSADLTMVRANHTKFQNAFFGKADLSDGDFENADFAGAFLIDAVLPDDEEELEWFEGGIRSKQDLLSKDAQYYLDDDEEQEDYSYYAEKPSFEEIDFTEADLSHLDFSGANFTLSNLRRADFYGCDLTGANFDNAIMDGVDITSAKIMNNLQVNEPSEE